MSKRDLFVVVADLDAENAIKTLLHGRQEALQIRLDFNPERHPQGDLLRYSGRDSGCYKDAVDLLRPPQNTHWHALLIFDRDGCGAEGKSRVEIERAVEEQLYRSGWTQGDVAVIVIEPELEAWVWANSPRVAEVLGWRNERSELREFLNHRDLWHEGAVKPSDPKEALKQSLRRKGKQRVAPLFSELASKVGLGRCQDPAFAKLRSTLSNWFGRNAQDTQ